MIYIKYSQAYGINLQKKNRIEALGKEDQSRSSLSLGMVIHLNNLSNHVLYRMAYYYDGLRRES